jgi:3-oxoacyl-[acyl-carrier protein] reductase
VTGASGGIGAASALSLAEAGADVVVHANANQARADEVASAVAARGRRSWAVTADLATEEGVDALFAAAERASGGRLDILFNNAGIFPLASLEELDAAAFDRVMAVNVRAPMLCSRRALPMLRRSAAARIVNISSNTVERVPPATVAYVTSKAAVIGLTRALARELGPDGITVNCLVPSLIRTESAQEAFGHAFDRTVGAQAIPREQTPEELAAALVFLCTDGAGFVTGQTINVDGGLVFR